MPQKMRIHRQRENSGRVTSYYGHIHQELHPGNTLLEKNLCPHLQNISQSSLVWQRNGQICSGGRRYTPPELFVPGNPVTKPPTAIQTSLLSHISVSFQVIVSHLHYGRFKFAIELDRQMVSEFQNASASTTNQHSVMRKASEEIE
jgi:hypothetical protein